MIAYQALISFTAGLLGLGMFASLQRVIVTSGKRGRTGLVVSTVCLLSLYASFI
jgi:hypothetical protein